MRKRVIAFVAAHLAAHSVTSWSHINDREPKCHRGMGAGGVGSRPILRLLSPSHFFDEARDGVKLAGKIVREEAEVFADETLAIRSRLLDALRRELMGPESDEETLSERPIDRYVVGRLAPASPLSYEVEAQQNEAFDSAVLEEKTPDEDAGDYDDTAEENGEPPAARSRDPSSFGLSFLVASEQQSLRARVTWGDYDHFESRSSWKRQPRETCVDKIPVNRPGKLGPYPLVTGTAGVEVRGSQDAGLVLQGVVRDVGENRAVSLYVVNRRASDEQRTRDPRNWIYQPRLHIEDPDGLPIFHAKSSATPHGPVRTSDGDKQATELLYRAVHEFASGHGVSGQWTCAPGAPQATAVFTDFLPSHEVPVLVAAAQDVTDAVLDMRSLAQLKDADALVQGLEPIVGSYEKWIEGLKQTASSDDIQNSGEWQDAAAQNIKNCLDCAKRMRNGLKLLKDDSLAREAFGFANYVMWDQRIHSLWAAKNEKKDGELCSRLSLDEPSERTWRPFQMGYILLNLVGVSDAQSTDRKCVDLLWFPTGGGKTEAYLGLSAYVLALRRLRGKLTDGRRGAGVGIIMRYTLRLLTVQQFKRALAMICACEIRRREDVARWGNEPFLVGIWVGGDTTPNTFDQSYRWLNVSGGERWKGGSPIVLVSCPRCGESLVQEKGQRKGSAPLRGVYDANRRHRRTYIFCPNQDCDFCQSKSSYGLPAVVVDEEVYRTCPSMVIATVDKFARIPYEGRTRTLFGLRNRFSPTFGHLSSAEDKVGGKRVTDAIPAEPLPPPDLIIQDELHLISGPLGTMVGLYESIVDYGTRRRPGEGYPAKIIASTATIRRASAQTRQLYGADRHLAIFPPSGLNAGESYFSRELPIEKAPGRLYVGVNAPGISNKTLMVRVYSVLLATAGEQILARGETGDPYGTLVGYFNSLRTLGGAKRVVEDDVKDRLKVVSKRENFKRRPIESPKELTSRMNSADIPALLKHLDVPFPRKEGAWPIDVLLATNMISVGVDVNRLGLMVVSGQPKTTAEYIQATSRAGRKHPGLIVTMYNWMGARDTSHYERFKAYHRALHRYVEATHVTPFSERALDRGLPAVFTAMVRLSSANMAADGDARNFKAGGQATLDIKEMLKNRAKDLVGEERSQYVHQLTEGLCDQWMGLARAPLIYRWETTDRNAMQPDNSRILLRGTGSDGLGQWSAPTSLREVEPTAQFYLDDFEAI